MAYEIHQLLEAMIENGASDLHLHVGRAPSLRVSGSVISIDGPALTPEDTENLVQSITPPRSAGALEARRRLRFRFFLPQESSVSGECLSR